MNKNYKTSGLPESILVVEMSFLNFKTKKRKEKGGGIIGWSEKLGGFCGIDIKVGGFHAKCSFCSVRGCRAAAVVHVVSECARRSRNQKTVHWLLRECLGAPLYRLTQLTPAGLTNHTPTRSSFSLFFFLRFKINKSTKYSINFRFSSPYFRRHIPNIIYCKLTI